MDWRLSLGGLAVGLLMGLTGMGGGTLMTPMLIFLFHMRPTLAVGTDLVYTAITKWFGAVQHIRQRTVDFPALRWLASGSVPGALAGSLLVGWMTRHVPLTRVEPLLDAWLGGVYVVVIACMGWRWYVNAHRTMAVRSVPPRLPRAGLLTLGLLGGFLVGVTSVGSGSIYIAVLTVIYPIAGVRLVGTDVAQAALLTAVAGITHAAFGNVDLRVVASLLCGSVPGVLVGSRLAARIPDSAVRMGLLAMLCYTSYSLLTH